MNTTAKILVIVPENESRGRLSALLADQGFQVAEADSGTDGVAKATACRPDLILLEPELSDMDGVQLTKRIRRGSELPILVLAHCRDEREIVRALNSGADDYLAPPWGAEELLARIRAALRRFAWRLGQV